MKKRLLSSLLVLCIVLTLLPGTALAADSPAKSSNLYEQHYNTYSSTVKSYLYENESGGLTRVEYEYHYDGAEIVVENYDSSFQFQSGQTIPMELDIWGGFFAGETYNFLVFGQKNLEEDNHKEVIRVVKYSKNWERLGQASLYGADTTVPFAAGSLRTVEHDGELYIRTSHEIYTSDDGLNHQTSLTLAVRESDMTLSYSYFIGLVSHSFNQLVIIDQQQRIVMLDHGDAGPRGMELIAHEIKEGHGNLSNRVFWANVQSFPGEPGDNITGASLGGLAETTNGYVVAYNYDGKGSSDTATDRSVYFAYVDKNSRRVETKSISSAGTLTPVLVPTSLNGGYILWNICDADGRGTDTLYYAAYSNGGHVGEVKTATASLSDCQPIVYNGKVVWYATGVHNPSPYLNNIVSTTPIFYQLDENGVTTIKTGPDDSGSSGDDLTWTLNDGILTIQGTGRMDDYSFYPPWYDYREQIHTVRIGEGVTSIGESAFSGCSSLTSVTIPDGVTSIGKNAFSGCTSLTSVTIPRSVTRVEVYAFSWCDSLTDVYFDGNEYEWAVIWISYINDPLRNVNMHYSSTASEDDTVVVSGKCGDSLTWIFGADGTLTIQGTGSYTPDDRQPWYVFREQIHAVIINSGVTSIGEGAFSGCRGLTNVTIPSSVTSIGEYVFYCCTSLTNVAIPNSVTTIGDSAFRDCSSLTSVTIPNSVISIGNSAFSGCRNLTNVTIPSNVISIGDWAFSSCRSLTDVYYSGSENQWKQVKIGGNNNPLLSATIHYNSTGPAPTEPETPSIPAFTDVSVTAYYADAVAWAVENGITSGTGSGTFSPESNCTRAQIVTFLWRAADSPTVNTSNPFNDVTKGDYYYNAVLWAVQKGITSGTSASTFSPSDTCTRAQAVTFLYRAKNSPAISGANSFTDLTSGAYYTDAVQWAVNTNVTVGTSSTTFSPDQNCTRAQIVTFLYRDRAN